MKDELDTSIDFDKAIVGIENYRELVDLIRHKMNEAEDLKEDKRKKLRMDYEVSVRPYVQMLQMSQPGEEVLHGDKITYEDPVEWVIKRGSYWSYCQAIIYLDRLIGRLTLLKSNPQLYRKTFGKPAVESALARILQAMRMFHTSAAILAKRRKDHQVLVVKDEYDVQDILHCILKPQFPDINPEEYSPAVGSQSKRIDLVIRSARIVIEIKFAKNKTTSAIVDDLKVDIESYHTHDSCGTLICFIYNPEVTIKDPEKIVQELSGPRTIRDHIFEVIVAIHPR